MRWRQIVVVPRKLGALLLGVSNDGRLFELVPADRTSRDGAPFRLEDVDGYER